MAHQEYVYDPVSKTYYLTSHEHEDEAMEQDNPFAIADNFTLKSVGIDIGSSGTMILFSEIKLMRMGLSLSSQYMIVSKRIISESPVYFTPYIDEITIDGDALRTIISLEYQRAGFSEDSVDTGALILTGEAIRRRNARAIGESLSSMTGKFISLTAGHSMESILAANGSGAVELSRSQKTEILNVDIGGGTTKFARILNGEVLSTDAISFGGRQIVWDDGYRIIRLEDSAKKLAFEMGITLKIGDRITEDTIDKISSRMADSIALGMASDMCNLKSRYRDYMLTEFEDAHRIKNVTFSGGVSEYIYATENEDFHDLGRKIAEALMQSVSSAGYKVHESKERIRATVIGASQYTVQLTGNTIFLTDPDMLPITAVKVLHPDVDLSGTLSRKKILNSIRKSASMYEIELTREEFALMLHWSGDASSERIHELAGAIYDMIQLQGLENKEKPIILVFDRDIAQLIGTILQGEFGLSRKLISIDGIDLESFDFIDLGSRIEPAGILPVTVKSLAFSYHGN